MTRNRPESQQDQASRRKFIRDSSLLVAGGTVAGSTLTLARSVHAAGSDIIKLGLVGCGGRGTGAANQALNTRKGEVKLISLGDVFPNKVQAAYRGLKGARKGQVDVSKDRMFSGLDAYQKVLDSGIDMVILATPPGFRPQHFEAAVEKGIHIFMEKPLATDAYGVRRILEANEKALKKKIAVAVGLQRHHEELYRETIAKLQDGAIGRIDLIRVYWNGQGVWTRPRQPDQTELAYQLNNWYYFNWICGDHIVEQHIHNLDVANWLKGAYPVVANGMGGRQVRTEKEHGQIFDHHFVEFTYEDGTKLFSQCRHIRGCWQSVSEHCQGTKGYADISGGKIYDTNGKLIWRSRGSRGGHQQEHHDLFASLRAGEIPNEAEYGAKSTMTSILGRMATYSGKQISWKDAIEHGRRLADTDKLTSFHSEAPVKPNSDGTYPIPVPGITEVLETA